MQQRGVSVGLKSAIEASMDMAVMNIQGYSYKVPLCSPLMQSGLWIHGLKVASCNNLVSQ